MNQFKRGTPAFGIALGAILAGIAVVWMAIGFWKTLLLVALFALGYFLGASDNAADAIRRAANRVIPKKEPETINLRSEIVREQKARMEQMKQSAQETARAEREASEEE